MYAVKTSGSALALTRGATEMQWHQFQAQMDALEDVLGPHEFLARLSCRSYRFQDIVVTHYYTHLVWDARTEAGELWLMLNVTGTPVQPVDRLT